MRPTGQGAAGFKVSGTRVVEGAPASSCHCLLAVDMAAVIIALVDSLLVIKRGAGGGALNLTHFSRPLEFASRSCVCLAA